ncbi:tRNA isopentenyl-2-thiomethyl-A-37 hydroxylase MiaE [Lonsdalea quercina]|uniref:tRNA-(Ms[2]io[6]A)-hydroxylase n=1 Tax=Lonsdalea quercina TaxID=71657 RepID=A0A1H3W8I3_9GAMM|nr:tRNA isopentenyl-2-thiomethyl-A-37 hydroxylase MiaE [Lonsdalea quercina]SDZ82734.1 tRNA-(ms[2]io[6]A)-hydroxylase [Lonsdalea quercina]
MFDRAILTPIYQFLTAETPDEWVIEAQKADNLPTLLRDHALCELKAAQNAAHLLRRYAVDESGQRQLMDWLMPYENFAYHDRSNFAELEAKNPVSKQISIRTGCRYGQDMIDKMVLLIKEELHHFHQVLEIMASLGIVYQRLPASRYAKGMLRHVMTHEPNMLVDKLIIGAFIEARSCERFAKLAPYLDSQLQKFYLSLLRSEARHYQDYLALAKQIADRDILPRIAFFAEIEANLIVSPDDDFKFHSGKPRVDGPPPL